MARHQIPIHEIDPWIDHLGSCSECFADFNRFKVTHGARRKRLILYVAAACLVLASAGFLWRQLSREHELSPSAGTPATNQPAVTPQRGGPPDIVKGVEKKPFAVILNLTRSATRGGKSVNDGQNIRVPARLLACRMVLPFGSPDGMYYVKVRRVAQSAIVKAVQGNATIIGGDVQLDVELDLSNVSTGRYVLSYRHASDSWHSVPIVIKLPKD